MGSARIARTVLATFMALVVAAWFIVGARQAHEFDLATPAAASPSPAQQRIVPGLLHSASFLYPGQDVALLRSRLALSSHRYAAAERILRRVVRREPDNLSGWAQLLEVHLNDRRIGDGQTITANLKRLDPVDIDRDERR